MTVVIAAFLREKNCLGCAGMGYTELIVANTRHDGRRYQEQCRVATEGVMAFAGHQPFWVQDFTRLLANAAATRSRFRAAFFFLQRKAQQTYKELTAKERLLQQQNSVREGVQRKQSAAAAGAPPPLPEGWKEIKDPKTGSTYYWNKVASCSFVTAFPQWRPGEPRSSSWSASNTACVVA